jgi:hypothetical protein
MVEASMVGSNDLRQAFKAIPMLEAQHDRQDEARSKAAVFCLNAASEVADLVLVPRDLLGEFVIVSLEMVHITASRSCLRNMV